MATKVTCHICQADITDYDIGYHYSRHHFTEMYSGIPRDVLTHGLKAAYETIATLREEAKRLKIARDEYIDELAASARDLDVIEGMLAAGNVAEARHIAKRCASFARKALKTQA